MTDYSKATEKDLLDEMELARMGMQRERQRFHAARKALEEKRAQAIPVQTAEILQESHR